MVVEPPPPLIRHLQLDAAGIGVHCLAAGERGWPIIMLLAGGIDAAGLSFRWTIPALAKDHRVFAPDWPGFGESDPMPPDWRVEECIQFIQEFLEVLDLDRVSLIGLSMGGAFAIGFTLRSPACVERLVLVDSVGSGGAIPGGLRSYLALHLPFLDELRWAVVRRNRTVVHRILCAPLVCHPALAIDQALDEIMLMVRKPGAGAAFRRLRRSEYRWRGFRTNYLERLSEIQVPTLIVHGADDPLVPVISAERAHHRVRHSQLEIIPRCGHLPPIEQPEVFNELVCRFMEDPRRPIRDRVHRVLRRRFPVAARPAGPFFWRRTPADSSRAKSNGKCLKLEPTSLARLI
jgi:pimeloyl-ACP methyl ester carboxylesterase